MSLMPVIRRAMPEDASRLADFAARTFAEAFACGTPPDDLALHLANSYATELQEAEIRDPGTSTFIAEDGARIAGFFQIRSAEPPDFVPERRSLELRRFYVDAPWHGRGLARALMEVAAGEGRRRGAPALWLSHWEENPRAASFYHKVGFRFAGSRPFAVGTDIQTDHILVRELEAFGEEAEVRGPEEMHS